LPSCPPLVAGLPTVLRNCKSFFQRKKKLSTAALRLRPWYFYLGYDLLLIYIYQERFTGVMWCAVPWSDTAGNVGTELKKNFSRSRSFATSEIFFLRWQKGVLIIGRFALLALSFCNWLFRCCGMPVTTVQKSCAIVSTAVSLLFFLGRFDCSCTRFLILRPTVFSFGDKGRS